jgi:hypothetical protein
MSPNITAYLSRILPPPPTPNPRPCAQIGVRGYPTLKIFPVDKTFNPYTKKTAKLPLDYNGPRAAKGMVEHVLAQMPDMVHAVKADNVTEFLGDENYPKALLFSDKAATSPLFKALAIQFKGRMRMGKASVLDQELAGKFGVEGSAKLVVVPGTEAEKHVVHEGKLKKDQLQVVTRPLHPTPYFLLYTPYPTHYTLHPTTSALNPTPYSLSPTP